MILLSGIYFSVKFKFIQLNVKKIFNKKIFNKDNLSSLFLTLGGRIGIGSISGVALAIYIGGPGTVFWMWIFGIIVTVNAFTESVISVKYHHKIEKNQYIGGPFYYISKGTKSNILAKLYSIVIIIAYLFGFIPIQTNSITKSLYLNNIFTKAIFGIIIVIVLYYIFSKGTEKIKKVNSFIVPFMIIIYLSFATYICLVDISQTINSLKSIINNALKFKPFLWSFLPMVIIGMQRGIFSNEAGLGTGAISAATTKNEPINQGYIQILGVYIATLLIATATALIIINSNAQNIKLNDINGVELALFAFKYFFNNVGVMILSIFIILFAFSTLLTSNYIIESASVFLNHKIHIIFILISAFLGTIINSEQIWSLINTFVSLLAIINIYSLLKMRKEIIKYIQNMIK